MIGVIIRVSMSISICFEFAKTLNQESSGFSAYAYVFLWKGRLLRIWWEPGVQFCENQNVLRKIINQN